MIDFRLYRAAWLPAVAAFVMVMFSLQGIPEPPDPHIAPATFDGERAAATAVDILGAGPERRPGSDGAEAAARLVLERFEGVPAGTAASQAFEMNVDGSQRELQNVVLTLSGDSDEILLVVAPRDTAPGGGAGAASSAAATGALVELGEVLGSTEHAKTVVLVSTDAATEGAEGIRRFLDSFADRERIETAIVLSQPGFDEPRAPHVLRHATDDTSTSIGLVRTAEEAIAEQAMRDPGDRGSLFSDLARLALPVAYGEQSVLISEGIDAIAISAAGEKPLAPSEDTEERLDPEVLAQFGAAALAVVLLVDPLPRALEHGPEAYVELSGSLIPGWALGVLALALVLPAAVAAADGIARAVRSDAGEVHAMAWAVGLAFPPLASLAALHLLGVVGLLADPGHPFDPGLLSVGFAEALVMLVLLASWSVAYVLTGLLRAPEDAFEDALVPAVGVVAVAGALGIWALNPFLGLLVAPLANVWLLAAREEPSRVLVVAGVAAAALPVLLALGSSLGAIGAGPWDLLLMIAGGQVPALVTIAACLLAGAMVGLLVLALRGRLDRPNPLGGGPQGDWGPAESLSASASIN